MKAKNVILAKESIRDAMQEPWTKGRVDSHLSAMIYWVRNGYEFTEEQLEQLGWLCEFVGGDDEDR